MPLFGNGSGTGFFNELKSTLGLSPRDRYDDEYDPYNDNFDDFSSYDDDYRSRGYDEPYDSRGYDDNYGDVIERDPRDYERSWRPRGELALPSMQDVRRNASRMEMDRRNDPNRHSFHSSDYLSSGAVERESASQSYGMPKRPRYADQGGANRALSVVAPMSFDDAERVAEALKAKSAVVLDLTKTRPDVVKRILDFSFGAASVSGANVDCIANKVFAITIGAPITEGEKVRLRSQGVRL